MNDSSMKNAVIFRIRVVWGRCFMESYKKYSCTYINKKSYKYVLYIYIITTVYNSLNDKNERAGAGLDGRTCLATTNSKARTARRKMHFLRTGNHLGICIICCAVCVVCYDHSTSKCFYKPVVQ